MTAFDFRLPTRLVHGAGKLEELGALSASLAAPSRALVVSDKGVQAAGHTRRGCDALARAGWETCVFDGFGENPDTGHVDAGVAVARDCRPDVIVGLGGGSSMDCAKGINFLYSCGGAVRDYWGVGKATGPLLPMIAVPTTAGTGSEAQSFALISDAVTHVKMACGDKRAAFRVALLDPELTLTQPPRVTALTGLDALAHAVETAVTRVRTPLSLLFSREAWRLLAPNFARVLERPDDLAARAAMQWGACLAGLAIENSMLGAAHALANPLTAQFGVTHGEAVALMLPAVVRENARATDADYRHLLAALVDGGKRCPQAGDGPEELALFLEQAVRSAGLASTLTEKGVPRDALDALADDAARQWTGGFNPIPLATEDFRRLYAQVHA